MIVDTKKANSVRDFYSKAIQNECKRLIASELKTVLERCQSF